MNRSLPSLVMLVFVLTASTLSQGMPATVLAYQPTQTTFSDTLFGDGRDGDLVVAAERSAMLPVNDDPFPPQGNDCIRPVLRYWNNSTGRHFYTTDSNQLGTGTSPWFYEGIAFYVAATPDCYLP